MRLSKVDHRMPGNTCPACSHMQDAATAIDSDEAPQPGDFSVCLNCGSPAVFGEDLQLRPATPEEMATLTPQESIPLLAAVATAQMIVRKGRP